MHIDLNHAAPARMDADVAIIGAGAAGISMARALLAGGLRVILLESGGRDYEQPIADLNAGDNVGMDYYPLDHARLRLFGGTTAIWGGRCARFSSIDLAARPWVPHSGWPIRYADLARYYDDAGRVFGLPHRAPGADEVRAAGVPLPDFAEAELDTPLWLFDDQFDRFSLTRSADLIDHPAFTLVTHATVREIIAAPSGRGIDRLDVRSLTGQRIRVTARDFVLAAGGIENPRLLLASRSVMPRGLGNGYDQVGRYFMEHPHARGGRITGGRAWDLFAAFAKRRIGGTTLAPLIAPSADLQRREGLLNTSLTIAPRRPATGREAWAMRLYLNAKHARAPDRFGRTMWKTAKRAVGWLQQHSDPLRPWLLNRAGQLDVALVVRGEQAPNPDSRVTLADDVDAIGVPRAKLDWRTTDLDVASVAGLVSALGRECDRLGLGTVEMADWLREPGAAWTTDPLISAHPIGGYHHIGTTRMSADPRHGVTDADTRVHGIDNLFVAGSSLFPTSGWANPTLTIVAMALRTAAHLIDRADSRASPSLHLPRAEAAAAVA